MNGKTKEIRVTAPDQSDNGRPVVEVLTAEDVGNGRYRLVYSPGVVEGFAAGDEITVGAKGEPLLVARGGNVCVWVFFEEPGANKGPAAESLRRAIEAIGGWLDGGGFTSLVFTIPVSVGFTRIEEALERETSGVDGVTWMYGNVYNPADGKTPLKWWESQS